MMVSTYACSQCGAPIAVADSSAGIPTLCAACQQISPGGRENSAAVDAAPPVQPATARRNRWIILLVALCCLGLFCIISSVLYVANLPFTATLLENQQRNHCAGNLRQISDALDAYKLKFGSLPPPVLADSQGNPAHSWRILLLPFFDIEEYDELYNQYSFDEAWDGPNNSKLHKRMPDVYGCPSDPDAVERYTSYLALRTANSTVLGTPPVGLRSPNLDPAAQFLVVEVRTPGITWTEPRDLDVGQLTAGVNDPSDQGIGSYHLEGAHVLEDDADVTFLEEGDTGPGVEPPPPPAGGGVKSVANDEGKPSNPDRQPRQPAEKSEQ